MIAEHLYNYLGHLLADQTGKLRYGCMEVCLLVDEKHNVHISLRRIAKISRYYKLHPKSSKII